MALVNFIPATPSKSQRVRVLIAEDSQLLIEALQRLLETLGRYEVAGIARHGREIVEMVQACPPDLILMDIMMPEMDGLEATRLIKARPNAPRVIIMTATPTAQYQTAARNAGADGFLKKSEIRQQLPTLLGCLYGEKSAPAGLREDRKLEPPNNMRADSAGELGERRERRVAQAQIERLNQLLRAVHDINGLIFRERDRQRLLDAACNILVQTRGYRMVCIGQADADSKRIMSVARAGQGIDYLDRLHVTQDDPDAQSGPVGTALRTRQVIVRQDIAGAPLSAPWREIALAGGCASVVATPMLHDERVFGVVAVYADHAQAFDRDELSLLQELARDLALALRGIDLEEVRKETEERMGLLSTALESAANAIVITDRAGNITWANPSFARLTGYSMSEYLGQNLRLLKSGQHDPAFYQGLWNTVLAGRVWRGEMTNRRKDGRLYQEESTITPVHNAQGGIEHFIVVKEDITQRKQLEAQFRQAQKMEAVGQLAGGVAHDFNNILTAILLQLQLLQQTQNLNSETRDSLQEVEHGAQRAANLTRQLLLFSRRQVMQPTKVDLNQVTAGLMKMLKRLLGEHIDTVFAQCAEPAWVEADPGMIEQLVMNLCVNARDAMPKGGHLNLSTRLLSRDAESANADPNARAGNFVSLTVSDDGCGMDPSTLERIFEPFFTTKEAGKGTGLGLATVHGIVKQHNGWIEVESTPGRGSAFHVFLPRVDKPMPVEPAPARARPRGGSDTILLVEDDESVRQMVRMTLKRSGYDVLEASSGVEAVQVWERHGERVSLLLADQVMPHGITGLELAKRLRRSRPDLKVLISSGYSADLLQQEGPLPSGMKFLSKPYPPDALARKIREILDHNERTESAQPPR